MDQVKRENPEQRGDATLTIDDLETLFDDPLQVDPSPAYDAGDCRIGAGLDDRRQRAHLLRRQTTRTPGAWAVRQAIRPFDIEAVCPIPQRLAIHSAASPLQPGSSRRRRPPGPEDGGSASDPHSAWPVPEGWLHYNRRQAQHSMAWRSSFACLASHLHPRRESSKSTFLAAGIRSWRWWSSASSRCERPPARYQTPVQ